MLDYSSVIKVQMKIHTFGKARYIFYSNRMSSLAVLEEYSFPINSYAHRKQSCIKDYSRRGKIENGGFVFNRARNDARYNKEIITIERSKYFHAISVNQNYHQYMMKYTNSLEFARDNYYDKYHFKSYRGYINHREKLDKNKLQRALKMTNIFKCRGLI